MKLRLPRVLLLACLAALPSMANTTDLSTISWGDGPIPDWSSAYVAGDLTASGEVSLTKRWLNWSGESVTLSGTATLKAVCAAQSADDDENCTCALLQVGSKPYSGGSKPDSGGAFTIDKGITLENVDINVDEGASLTVRGTIRSSCAVQGMLYVQGGTLDISEATLDIEADEFHVDMGYGYAEEAETTGATASVLKVGTLKVTSNLRMCLYFGSQIVDGALTLNQGAASAAKHSGLKFHYDDRQGGSGVWSQLTVTGTLTVADVTKVAFCHSYAVDTFSDEWDYAVPDSDTVLITASNVQGNLSALRAYASCEAFDMSDGGKKYAAEKLLDTYRFVSRATADGYSIYLVASDTPGENPGGDPGDSPGEVHPPISTGSVSGELTEGGQRIDFGSGNGTVDATAVSDGLNTQNVRGQSGTLVTSDTQTMDLLGNSTLGYSIAGTSDAVAGAALLMRGNAVELRGASYHVANVTVNSGTLDVSSQTELEVAEGGKIQLNSALNNYGDIKGNVELNAAKAALDNRGEIAGNVDLNSAGSVFANNGTLTGDLTAAEGSSVRGNGIFIGTSCLTNATMHIGNSPGRMTYTGNTVLDGMTLEFTLDGLRASQGATDTVGTYSTVVFNGGELTITNGLTLKLDASDAFLMELLDAQPDSVTLALMDVSGATNAGDAALTAALAGAEIQFTGVDAAILENVTLDGSGTLTATVNQALLAALMTDNGAELADTMQSSARLLEDFSEMSTQQLSIVSAGETHAWLSGLGSFEDMGGAHGFRYHGGGAVVGVAHGCTDSLSVGVSLGYAEGTFKSDSGRVRDEQETTMFSLHGQYVRIREHSARWLTGYVAYGFTENDATTRVAGSTASPSWDDRALRVGAQYGVELPLAESVTMKPFIGVDYTRVEQEDFSERSAAVTTRYEDGRMQTLSVTPGVSLRRSIGLGGKSCLLPELTLAYVGDLVRDEPTVRRRTMGMSDKRRGSNPGRHAFSLRAGAFLIVDECTSFNAFYALETRSDETVQSVNAGVHVAF